MDGVSRHRAVLTSRALPPAGYRRIWLRLVQRKRQGAVGLQQARQTGRTVAPLVVYVQDIARLSQRRIRVRLVVCVWVPDDGGRGARYDTVRRSHWIRVPVLADGRDGEGRRRREQRGEIPPKGYGVPRCDFEEGCGGLRGLGDGYPASGSGLRDPRCRGR